MKWFTVLFSLFIVAFSLNATTSPELFRVRHDVVVKDDQWPSTVTRVQPIEFNREAILSHDRGISSQAFVAQPTEFTFPVEGIEYTLVRDKFGFYKVEGAEWSSRVVDSEDVVAGFLFLPDGEMWDITTRDGITYLAKHDYDAEVRNEMIVSSGVASSSKRRAVRHPANPNACSGEWVETIDLAGIYNARTLEWFSADPVVAERELRAYVENAVDARNATVINTTGALLYKMRLVTLTKVSYADSGPNDPEGMGKALSWVVSSEEVKKILDQYQADAVHFFLGLYVVGPGGTASDKGRAVSSVTHSAFVFVHERGHADHLMLHDDKHDVVREDRPIWAFDYYIDGVARGLMAYADNTNCPNGCPWQPIFATPYRNYEGTNLPAGVRDVYENWRMLEWTRGTVSMNNVIGNENQCVASTGGFAMQKKSTF